MKLSLFFYTIIILIISISTFNYIIDPYNLFQKKTQKNTPQGYDRELIYPKIKLSKNKKYDFAIIGGSNVDHYIERNPYNEIKYKKGIKGYKIAIQACQLSEQYYLIKNYIKIHPETKTIYISIDFDTVVDSTPNMLPKYQYNCLNKEEIIFLFFSKTTLENSIKFILDKIKNIYPKIIFKLKKIVLFSNIKYIKNYKQRVVIYYYRFPNLRFTNWGIKKINQENYKYIIKMKQICEANNIKPIFYTNPIHSYTLSDMFFQGIYKEFEQFKKDLVKITPYYDFSYAAKDSHSAISTKNPYWVDYLHADIAIGDKVLKKLIENSGDYGMYITKTNINNTLKKQKEILNLFINQNKKELNIFFQNKHLDLYEIHEIKYLTE